MPEEKKIGAISPEIPPQPTTPEKEILSGEKKEEKHEDLVAEPEEAGKESFVAPRTSAQTPIEPQQRVAPPQKSEELVAIERILEEELQDTYWHLPPPLRQKFKERGEKTAKKIERLLRSVHLSMVKVLKLIRKWLSMIPHVNRFFLEQEAKIKTDKIVALHRERHS